MCGLGFIARNCLLDEDGTVLNEEMNAVCLAILILIVSFMPPKALAVDPALSDLSGTDSSDWDSTTTTTVYASADSYMHQGNPTTNYGTATTMVAGKQTSNARRSIVRFDLSSIPISSYIDLANLSVYADTALSPPSTIGVYRVQQSPARDWTEAGVTWNRYDGTNSWTTAGGDFNSTATSSISISTTLKYYNWTVTYDVKNFVQTPSTNFGWVLKSSTEPNGKTITFRSRDYTGTSYDPFAKVYYIPSPYDIIGKTGVYGLEAGSDSDSLAIAMRLGDFAVPYMASGDKYEINFTIGAEDFSMMFVATGASAGNLKLCYKANGAPTWSDGDSDSFSSMSSGTRYASASGNIAVKLTSSTPSTYGWVKLEANRNYMNTLGATGYSVTSIDGIAYQGSSTVTLRPGAQGGTKKDRCPSGSNYASYTMVVIPEFPLGVFILAMPLMAIYLYIRERSTKGRVA